jgi:hypothetical protein
VFPPSGGTSPFLVLARTRIAQSAQCPTRRWVAVFPACQNPTKGVSHSYKPGDLVSSAPDLSRPSAFMKMET